MKLGYIGLGKMGKNMVTRLLEKEFEVVIWDIDHESVESLVKLGACGSNSVEDLVSKLGDQKIIWLMLPSGGPTEETIEKIKLLLNPGDIIIDGANSYYEDSVKRAQGLFKIGINFIDVGVSGGPEGAKNGACLMIGGEKNIVSELNFLWEAIASPEAFGCVGKSGAGHFSKMVHNGIEYGMMEAIAEGATVLKESDFNINLPEVFRIYNNRSVIESRLVGWTQEALSEDPNLNDVSSKIAHTGEGEWTIKTAEKLNVPVPVIKKSFEVRVESEKDNPNSPSGFRNKVVSALRGKFGGHKVKE